MVISRAILAEQNAVMMDYLDCAVVGAGPAGLTPAAYLAEAGVKARVIVKKLSISGGMWGGGMMFPRIVVPDEARPILDTFGITYKEYQENDYVASSIEAVSHLTAAACDAGAEFFNVTMVEDVVVKGDGRVSGLVINWTAVEMAHLLIDPLTLRTKYTIDATGHDSTVPHQVKNKGGNLPIAGEGFMWADRAEANILEHTREVFSDLIVAGMAANAVAGEKRMGPIFGGMLLSGRRAAERVIKHLS